MLFAAEAILLFREGVVKAHLAFLPGRRRGAVTAWALVAYALLYPAINAAQHHTWTRIPAFGVPCPTTIFTAGLLMLAGRGSWRLSAIPVIWSAIGGSAAPLLGVRADYALPVAGLALAIFTMRSAVARSSDGASGATGRSAKPHTSSTPRSIGLRRLQAVEAGPTRRDLRERPGSAP